MPPKRKSTEIGDESTASSQVEPTAKREKLHTQSAFPKFDDGDIVISLGSVGEADLCLHRKKLSRLCEYFKKYDENGWPKKFTLQPTSKVSECLVVPEGEIPPERHDHNNDGPQSMVPQLSEDDVAEYARRLNETVFQLLYRVPVDFSKYDSRRPLAHVLRDVAKLAASYGCIQHLQSELVSVIVAAGAVGGDFIRKNPCPLLETACLLKNETIFVEALRHAAGRRQALTDEIQSLPADTARLVERHAETLKTRVRDVCNSLTKPAYSTIPTWDVASCIAWSFFNQYLVSNVLSKDPDSPETFKALAHLNSMRTGMELVDTQQAQDIMQSLTVIACGLEQASNIGCDTDLDEDALNDVNRALNEQLTVQRVKQILAGIVGEARRNTSSLFSGDRNAEYFTFAKFEGRFPWECDSSKHT